jgi:hypothetical protein
LINGPSGPGWPTEDLAVSHLRALQLMGEDKRFSAPFPGIRCFPHSMASCSSDSESSLFCGKRYPAPLMSAALGSTCTKPPVQASRSHPTSSTIESNVANGM